MRSSHLIDLLRTRLPGNEVEYAVEDALLEAGAVGENFQGLGGGCGGGPSTSHSGAYCFWAVEDALLEAGAVGEAFV